MKAVVFVDCQKDFLKGGCLGFGYPSEDNFQKIVEFAKECASDSECKIYATRDTHERTEWIGESPDGKTAEAPIAGYLASLEGKRLPVEHCIEGTDGWMVDDQLMEALDRKATYINKPTFGSYDLADVIKEDFAGVVAKTDRNLDEIILVGYCTSICVMANAVMLRAKFPNTKIVVKQALCGCISKESHETALAAMKMQQIDVE